MASEILSAAQSIICPWYESIFLLLAITPSKKSKNKTRNKTNVANRNIFFSIKYATKKESKIDKPEILFGSIGKSSFIFFLKNFISLKILAKLIHLL